MIEILVQSSISLKKTFYKKVVAKTFKFSHTKTFSSNSAKSTSKLLRSTLSLNLQNRTSRMPTSPRVLVSHP